MYRVQFEVAETMEQVFVGLRFKFYSLHPIPYDFEHLKKRISKTKYTVPGTLLYYTAFGTWPDTTSRYHRISGGWVLIELNGLL